MHRLEDVEVRFVPFNDFEPGALGARLSDIVRRNEVLIGQDFPAIPTLYRSDTAASLRVEHISRQVEIANGRLGAFAVVITYKGVPNRIEDVYGVATFQQWQLPFWRWRWSSGVLCAVWLDRKRPAEKQMVGEQLLAAGERLLIGHAHQLRGRLCTLVVPGRPYVEKLLRTTDRFGGFDASKPGSYPKPDGVKTPRRLWVAREDIGTTAARLGHQYP